MADFRRAAIAAPAAASKKLVIKLARSSSSTTAADNGRDAAAVTALHNAVSAVFEKRAFADLSMEDLYRSVENLCLQKRAEWLYAQLCTWIDAHLGAAIVELRCVHTRSSADTAPFLIAVDSLWQDFCLQLRTIRLIFLYLDRTHVISKSDVRYVVCYARRE